MSAIWQRWIDACKDNPNHIIVLGPDEWHHLIDATDFEQLAIEKARYAGAEFVHVKVARPSFVLRMQFCWYKNYHQTLHIDGASLSSADYWRYAPWPRVDE